MESIGISDGATLEFEISADAQAEELDINFYDSTQKNALVHIMFRPVSNRIIFNTLFEGEWDEELVCPADLSSLDKTPASLRFDGDRLSFTLNDTQFEAHLARAAQAGDICFMVHAVGVNPRAMRVDDQQVFWGSVPVLSATDDKAPVVAVREARDFVLRGTLTASADHADNLQLLCNGQLVEAPVIIGDADYEQDSTGSRGGSGALDFELEVPGYVWNHCDSSAINYLQIQLGENRFPEFPIPLTITLAAGWVDNICSGPKQAEQYWMLLALEHVHFAGVELAARQAVREQLAYAARRFKLEDYAGLEAVIDHSSSDRNLSENEAKLAPDRERVHLAMAKYNQMLPQWKGREINLLHRLAQEYRLRGEALLGYRQGLVPYLCTVQPLKNVAELLSVQRAHDLSCEGDAYLKSIALPFLVNQRNWERCGHMLYEIQGAPGWINTECLLASMQQLTALNEAEYEHRKIEALVSGFIGLLDWMAQEYWSRLHDENLVRAFICLLQRPQRWHAELLAGVLSAALRIYGLSPTFWRLYSEHDRESHNLLSRLDQAHKVFTSLQLVINDRTQWASELGAMRDALVFFRRYGNGEADHYLREIMGNILTAGPPELAPDEVDLLVRDLVSSQAEDAIRVAAFPAGTDQLPASLYDLKQITIEAHDWLHHSPRYQAQFDAQAQLVELEELLQQEQPGDALESLLCSLMSSLRLLETGENAMLGLDLQVQTCALLKQYRTLQREMMAEVVDAVVKNIWDSDFSATPCAPLLAAIGKLLSLDFDGVDSVEERDDEDVESIAAMQLHLLTELERGFETQTNERITASLPSVDIGRQTNYSDTLVVVYSCRPNLESRIQAIRNTWLKDLQRLGIPYAILVGEGDDCLHGDVLELDVPDSYEDLPAKSLKMAQWVLTNTAYQYVVKIDDDCYLNAEQFFNSLSYRKFHYYGRRLTREVGTMDRAWHHAKSSSERARGALDKSLEPAVYADGGSGYSLSRYALQTLADVTVTAQGRRLIASSFMEDKLMGDLLRLGDIRVEDEDYFMLLRRKLTPESLPVSLWENSFYPGQHSPAKLAHLDTRADEPEYQAYMNSETLWPRKIWPSYTEPRLDFCGQQLELITDEMTLQALLQEQLVVVGVMRNELEIVKAFLSHYRSLGIKAFILVDNASDDGTREFLAAQSDVVLYSADTDYKFAEYGVAWQQAILANHCIGKWVVLADADEFLVYPNSEQRPLTELVAAMDEEGADAACIYMVDMYPQEELSAANFSNQSPFVAAPAFEKRPLSHWALVRGPYGNAPCYTNALRHRLVPGAAPHQFTSQKYSLIKYAPWMRLSIGLHFTGEINISRQALWYCHFKYNASFGAKVRLEIARKQHFDNAIEYLHYQGMLAESRGCFFDSQQSALYVNSADFVQAVEQCLYERET